MNIRMLQTSFVITILPLVTIGLLYLFEGHLALQICLLMLGMALHGAAVLFSRKKLREVIEPDRTVMAAMDLPVVTAAYEPGKFRWDVRISTALTWISLPAPALCLLVQRLPGKLPLEQARGLGPAGILLLTALGAIVVGTIAMAYWARVRQAAVIAWERSDRRRYQLRGFAEIIDKPGSYARFLNGGHPVLPFQALPGEE